MKRFILSLVFCFASSTVLAQNPTCPTRPAGDTTNACASTAFVQTGGPWVVSPPSISFTTTLAPTGTCIVPAATINATDNTVVTSSGTDSHGNYTPEGWSNANALNLNWTSGSAGIATGARTPLLVNVFLTHPSSPSNTAGFYAGAILTTNIYTDDNGTLGSEKGAAFGIATVTYLKNTVKHWSIALGGESDFTVESGAAVLRKIGYQVSSFSGANGLNDAVQGSVVDAAFLLNACSGCVGFKNGYTAELSAGGGNPFSSTGSLLSTIGAVTMANAIDVSSATVTGNLFKSGPFNVTGQGAIAVTLASPLTGDIAVLALVSPGSTNHIFTTLGRLGSLNDLVTGVVGVSSDFMTSTSVGDAVFAYGTNLWFGHLAALPRFGMGAGFMVGTMTDEGLGTVNATQYFAGSTAGLASKTCTINNTSVGTGITITIKGGIITGTTTC